MENENHGKGRRFGWVRWTARIWGTLIVIIVAFILIGSISSRISGETDPYAVGETAPIENIPPLFIALSAVGLALAWRWEGIGGAIAVFFQLAALPVLLIYWPIKEDFLRYLAAPYGVSLMTAIPGILYLIYWWKTKKGTSPNSGS